MHGSVGEIADITSVAGPKGAQSSSPPERPESQQSERLRALNLEAYHRHTEVRKTPAEEEKATKTISLYC
jgi:hypothetical protein